MSGRLPAGMCPKLPQTLSTLAHSCCTCRHSKPVPYPDQVSLPPPSYRRVPLVCAEASSAQEDLLTQAEMVRDAICSFCSGVPSVSQEEEVQQ